LFTAPKGTPTESLEKKREVEAQPQIGREPAPGPFNKGPISKENRGTGKCESPTKVPTEPQSSKIETEGGVMKTEGWEDQACPEKKNLNPSQFRKKGEVLERKERNPGMNEPKRRTNLKGSYSPPLSAHLNRSEGKGSIRVSQKKSQLGGKRVRGGVAKARAQGPSAL